MATGLQKDRQSLIDEILRLGELSFDPSNSEDSQIRQSNLVKFRFLLDNTSAFSLLPVLTQLINSDRIFPWLKEPLSSVLAHIPLRHGGIQDTIEFVLSVHPSTSGLNGILKGKGSFISYEALNAVSRLLSSPPSNVSAESWFCGISPQLLSLLQAEGESEMDRAAAFIIGFGILGKKQYGSPGRPGWKAFVEPIFKHLNPSSIDIEAHDQVRNKVQIIETVRPRKILSTPLEVAHSLQKLTTLLKSHPNPSLSVRILKPILYPLWILSSWANGNELTEALYQKPARKLLKTLLQLWPTKMEPARLSLIAKVLDIIALGQEISTQVGWKFVKILDGSIQLEKVSFNDQITNDSDLELIDHALDSFMALLKELPELTAEISTLFINLSSKWLTKKSSDNTVKYSDENVRKPLVEAKAMQKMLTAFPERLIDDSKQLLELISHVLKNFNQTKIFESEGDSKSVLSIALSLFNTILTSPKFRVTEEVKALVDSIQKDLQIISRKSLHEISRTAGNLLMLLSLHDTISQPESSLSAGENTHTDDRLEEKKTYHLAISYLKAFESPPPVRAQGLELLSQLVQKNSSILDIPALIMLLLSLLGDNEEYVHLRVIQLLVQVSRKHPKTVMKEVVDRYVDSNEELELDERLRLGEALEQIIQTNNTIFKLETAQKVCQGLLFLGGQRGSRPKTEHRHEKEKLRKRGEIAEAEEAWGGPVPQLDESFDDDTRTNEIFLQIVTGWESKRGKEDVRIRSSAITILGTAIGVHIEGITSHILSAAVDLSIHVLTLEPEVETAILRRSSILLIMNLVKALDAARDRGQSLGFGLFGQGLVDLLRILKYIESTDRDSLVRQHSKFVSEELKTWQMKSLLPVQPMPSENMQNLCGLLPLSGCPEGSRRKPRIEEVE